MLKHHPDLAPFILPKGQEAYYAIRFGGWHDQWATAQVLSPLFCAWVTRLLQPADAIVQNAQWDFWHHELAQWYHHHKPTHPLLRACHFPPTEHHYQALDCALSYFSRQQPSHVFYDSASLTDYCDNTIGQFWRCITAHPDIPSTYWRHFSRLIYDVLWLRHHTHGQTYRYPFACGELTYDETYLHWSENHPPSADVIQTLHTLIQQRLANLDTYASSDIPASIWIYTQLLGLWVAHYPYQHAMAHWPITHCWQAYRQHRLYQKNFRSANA